MKVTSTPQRIRDAADASLRVLRSLKESRVTPRELLRAKRTLLARHETDLKDNAYRLGLLTHLQAPGVPLKVPEAVRDLRRMYEAATVDDVHEAYAQLALGEGDVFVCVGTSGPEEPAEPTVTPVDAGALAAERGGNGGAGAPFAAADAKSRELLAAIAASLQTKQIAEAVKAMAARMPNQGGNGNAGGGEGEAKK